MSFLGKLFGKKEKESLDQGLEKTKQGFFLNVFLKSSLVKQQWMMLCWMN